MAIDWEKVNDAGLKGMYGQPYKPKGRFGNVAKRTEFGGVMYDSKAEASYAAVLDDRLRTGTVSWWLRQVRVPLGPDFATRVDFLVGTPATNVKGTCWHVVLAVEIKGVETREFKKVRKLWPKYGPFALEIIKGTSVEIVEGKQ